MSLIDKLKTVIQAAFSSFMSIEILVGCILLLLLLIINHKIHNKFVLRGICLLFMGLVMTFVICFWSYIQICFDTFILKVLNYIYFPSTIVYFFLVVFCLFIFLYSMFSRKLSHFKKIFNYIIMILMLYCFSLFIAFSVTNHIDLADKVSLYRNNTILALVQISNLLFVGWGIFTGFYQLYLYFKRKFDGKEKIEN